MKEDKFECSLCLLCKGFDAFTSYMCASYRQVRAMYANKTLPPCLACRTKRERRVTV
jgi:hypothetical protein